MNSAEEDREPKSNMIRGTYDVVTTRTNMDKQTKNRRAKEHVSSYRHKHRVNKTRAVEPMMNNQWNKVT